MPVIRRLSVSAPLYPASQRLRCVAKSIIEPEIINVGTVEFATHPRQGGKRFTGGPDSLVRFLGVLALRVYWRGAGATYSSP